MENALLSLILSKGVHTASKDEVKRKWNEVNDELYTKPCFEPYKALHYQKGDYRYLREKFNRIRSRYSGELSERHPLISQICQEIDEQVKMKNSGREYPVYIPGKIESGKRKSVSGDAIELQSEGKRKPADKLDEAILNMVENMRTSLSRKVDEEVTEKDILAWMNSTGKSAEDLLAASDVAPTYHGYGGALELLKMVGVETIVSIYCSVGKGFDREMFQNALRELEFHPIIFHKIYVGLTSWRRQASNFAGHRSSFSPPQLTINSQNSDTSENAIEE